MNNEFRFTIYKQFPSKPGQCWVFRANGQSDHDFVHAWRRADAFIKTTEQARARIGAKIDRLAKKEKMASHLFHYKQSYGTYEDSLSKIDRRYPYRECRKKKGAY